MEFDLVFYETAAGVCPVRDFLFALKKRNPDDFAAISRGLGNLRLRCYHRPPLSKYIGDQLFELRHVGKLNTRIIYFFMSGRKMIAVHGIRNKSRSIPSRDRQTAIQRMTDWMARHHEEE